MPVAAVATGAIGASNVWFSYAPKSIAQFTNLVLFAKSVVVVLSDVLPTFKQGEVFSKLKSPSAVGKVAVVKSIGVTKFG